MRKEVAYFAPGSHSLVIAPDSESGDRLGHAGSNYAAVSSFRMMRV